MKELMLLAAITVTAASGCGDDDSSVPSGDASTDTDSDTDADSDTDSDSDTDADSGTDTDSDSDTGTGTDTGEPLVPPDGWEVVDAGFDIETLTGVWGSASDDVYVTGGQVFHWDGGGWSVVSGVGGAWGVWGTAADDVFVYGNDISHHDGATWSGMPLDIDPSGDSAFEECLSEPSPSHWHTIRDVWGLPGGPYFACGQDECFYDDGDCAVHETRGIILQLVDGTWTEMSLPVWYAFGDVIESVWGSSANGVYAASGIGGYYHFDGSSWSWAMACDSELTSAYYRDIQCLSPSEIYLFGTTSCAYDGEGWSGMAPFGFLDVYGTGGWAISADSVYAIGATLGDGVYDHGGIARRESSGWEILASDLPFAPYDVWSTPEEDVWVVGSDGVILRRSPE